MGNIADQFFTFPVTLQLLLCIVSQTNPHLFKCLHQFAEFVIFFRFDFKIQVAFLYILGGFLHLVDRTDDTSVNPHHHDHRGKCQDQDYRNACTDNKLLDLRHITKYFHRIGKILVFFAGNSVSMLNDPDLIARNSKNKCRRQYGRYRDHRHKGNDQPCP